MAHGLMFHHLHGGAHPAVQGSVSLDAFQRILDQHQDRLLRAEDFLAWHERGELEDEVCVTFDDGLRSQELALPVLAERGLTAFFFPYTAPLIGVVSRLELYRWVRTQQYGSVEAFYAEWRQRVHPETPPAEYLADRAYLTRSDREYRWWRDWRSTREEYEAVMDAFIGPQRPSHLALWFSAPEIRQLATAGHLVGNHTHTHPTIIAGLTHEQQELEYVTAHWILEGVLGTTPRVVSHPSNAVTGYGIGVLQRLGYTLGFTATPGDADTLQMPRENSAELVRLVPA